MGECYTFYKGNPTKKCWGFYDEITNSTRASINESAVRMDSFQHTPSIRTLFGDEIGCHMNEVIPKIFEFRGVLRLGEPISSILFRGYIVELQEATFNLLALPVVFNLHMFNPTMGSGIPRKAPSPIIIGVYYSGLVGEITESVAKLL